MSRTIVTHSYRTLCVILSLKVQGELQSGALLAEYVTAGATVVSLLEGRKGCKFRIALQATRPLLIWYPYWSNFQC